MSPGVSSIRRNSYLGARKGEAALRGSAWGSVQEVLGACPLLSIAALGGVLSIMEMNPQSPVFQRIFGNPFAYTAFKSTEPWLQVRTKRRGR